MVSKDRDELLKELIHCGLNSDKAVQAAREVELLHELFEEVFEHESETRETKIQGCLVLWTFEFICHMSSAPNVRLRLWWKLVCAQAEVLSIMHGLRAAFAKL